VKAILLFIKRNHVSGFHDSVPLFRQPLHTIWQSGMLPNIGPISIRSWGL